MNEPSLTQRLRALFRHLGVKRAHIATQMPGDIAGLAGGDPDRLGGVVLCVPTRLDPGSFVGVGDRMLAISGSSGLTQDVTARAAGRLAGLRRHVLTDYAAPGWADVVADRPAEIAHEIVSFLGGHPADAPRADLPAEGVHRGITWKKQGVGPALLLLPFFLAPSQWQPAVARLAGHFTVITLGGPHLGGVAALEDRAKSPTYRATVRTLLDLMQLKPGEALLDIGCGSGALDRLAAGWFPQAAITAVDSNPFLLSEAAALAESEGVGPRIRFLPGNAEALPFPDASFDAVFSVTVLEECDADRALAEMRRVLRPGGRMGVIVRSIDLPQWWSVPPPAGLAARMTQPPQSVGAKGVADASLYERARRAGFVDLVCFPSLVTLDRPEGPIWRYREDHLLAQLSPEETVLWRAARDKAAADGLLFMSHPMHCVVGTSEGAK